MRKQNEKAVQEQEQEQDTLQSNTALVRRWFEQVINKGDMQLLGEICAACHPNFVMIKGRAISPV